MLWLIGGGLQIRIIGKMVDAHQEQRGLFIYGQKGMLDTLILHFQQIKDFLEACLRCNCLRLEDCVIEWGSECIQLSTVRNCYSSCLLGGIPSFY